MNSVILTLINLIHLVFVLFILLVPFTNSNYLLLLHAIITPFMLFHWFLNDNTCALTLVEKYIRSQISGDSVKDEDCFSCRIINPIYDFGSKFTKKSNVAYIVVIGLFLISVAKLLCKYWYGEINSYIDLMKL